MSVAGERKRSWHLFPRLLLAVLGILALAPTTLADPVIGLSYPSTQDLSPGTIVATNQKSGGVESANVNNIAYLYGVVVTADQSLLSFTSTAGKQVQVATSGVSQMFVSDVNGAVVSGDAITASIISGVGMKATDNSKVIGTAQGSLADSQGKRTESITLADGTKQTVQLGVVPVAINISYFYKQQAKSVIPSAIQDVANAVAGRNVPALPIIISLVIFIVAVVSVGGLVYGAIRASIISVGRNPMAQAAVYRSLLQISGLILAILGAGLGAIYLILSRM